MTANGGHGTVVVVARGPEHAQCRGCWHLPMLARDPPSTGARPNGSAAVARGFGSADGGTFVAFFVHTAFMAFPDWREPTRLLEETAGPPTREQLDLAAKIVLKHVDEPRIVFAASLDA